VVADHDADAAVLGGVQHRLTWSVRVAGDAVDGAAGVAELLRDRRRCSTLRLAISTRRPAAEGARDRGAVPVPPPVTMTVPAIEGIGTGVS
jgi:hypothetical protein